MNYTLAIVHLGDRCVGGGPFVQQFPGSERAPTLAEVQEIQQRLTALGFDTGGTDGRVGNDTMVAARNYQLKVGLEPADGYAGLTLLARLRQRLVIRFDPSGQKRLRGMPDESLPTRAPGKNRPTRMRQSRRLSARAPPASTRPVTAATWSPKHCGRWRFPTSR